jgi:hypothetical protein
MKLLRVSLLCALATLGFYVLPLNAEAKTLHHHHHVVKHKHVVKHHAKKKHFAKKRHVANSAIAAGLRK